jgi:hypothetical protein
LSHTSSPFSFCYFGDGGSQTICFGWPQTMILLISGFQIVYLDVHECMSHPCPASRHFLLEKLHISSVALLVSSVKVMEEKKMSLVVWTETRKAKHAMLRRFSFSWKKLKQDH